MVAWTSHAGLQPFLLRAPHRGARLRARAAAGTAAQCHRRSCPADVSEIGDRRRTGDGVFGDEEALLGSECLQFEWWPGSLTCSSGATGKARRFRNVTGLQGRAAMETRPTRRAFLIVDGVSSP